MCEYILDSTHETYNVSENEYIKKCNEAIINNKSNNAKRFNEIIERFEIPNIWSKKFNIYISLVY